MQTVNIHEAKTHLSRLLEQASQGEAFIIAKAGKPLVKVVPLPASTVKSRRMGFMSGQFTIPDNFDRLGSDEIKQLFGSEE